MAVQRAGGGERVGRRASEEAKQHAMLAFAIPRVKLARDG